MLDTHIIFTINSLDYEMRIYSVYHILDCIKHKVEFTMELIRNGIDQISQNIPFLVSETLMRIPLLDVDQ